MGSFRRATSDLDILLVTTRRLDPGARRDLAALLVHLSDQRPLPGDIEVSAVCETYLKPFSHPTPYEVHYSGSVRAALQSAAWDFSAERVDRDLAAHCQVLRSRGVVLAGPPISAIVAPVPRDAYLDALLYDLADFLDGPSLITSPVYGILNSCRVLAALSNPALSTMNKEEGAIWGLAHMPRPQRILVGQALECQRGRWPISPEHAKTGGLHWSRSALEAFQGYVATEVSRLLGNRIAG
jgi:streptomycin 3"-adenylyltransferase